MGISLSGWVLDCPVPKKLVPQGGSQTHGGETVPAAAGDPHVKQAPMICLLKVRWRMEGGLSDSVQSFRGRVAVRQVDSHCWQVRNTALLC